MKKIKSIQELVDAVDTPAKRGDKWKLLWPYSASRKRTIFYAKKLRKLGLKDIDIQCLISDLSWEAVSMDLRINYKQNE